MDARPPTEEEPEMPPSEEKPTLADQPEEQPEEQPGQQEFSEDSLVSRLIPDPAQVPPDVTTLDGFLGKSTTPSHWRLYLTAKLDEYVEIATEDIVSREALVGEKHPLGGTRLWIKREAKLQYRRIESREIA